MRRPCFVLFIVDANSVIHHFSDRELDRLARRVGESGCDYIRTLLTWKRPGGRPSIMPFRLVNGVADWNQPEPEWDRQLIRLQKALNKYGAGLWLDIFAQQFDRRDYGWTPFRYNLNGFDTWRATTDVALFNFKRLIKRAKDCLAPGKHIIGWGNELVHPLDYQGDVPAQDNWARAWILPLAKYMKTIDVQLPVPFSASDNLHGTGHSIYNRLVKQAGWLHKDTFWVLHGCAIPAHFDRFPIKSVNKYYGISDDAVGLKPEISVPPEMQGLTISETGRRSSHWPYRVDLVRHVEEILGPRLRCIEVMPMELKRTIWHPDMLHQEESLDVFWRIAKEVFYGKDVRRSFPDPIPPIPPVPPPTPEPPTPPSPPEPPKPCSYWLKRWDFRRWFKCIQGKEVD